MILTRCPVERFASGNVLAVPVCDRPDCWSLAELKILEVVSVQSKLNDMYTQRFVRFRCSLDGSVHTIERWRMMQFVNGWCGGIYKPASTLLYEYSNNQKSKETLSIHKIPSGI